MYMHHDIILKRPVWLDRVSMNYLLHTSEKVLISLASVQQVIHHDIMLTSTWVLV